MKGSYILFVVISLVIGACTSRPSTPAASTPHEIAQPISYEGEVSFAESKAIHLNIALTSNNGVDGRYNMSEEVIEDGIVVDRSEREGDYLMQSANNQTLLLLNNTARRSPLRRTSVTPGGRIREQNFRHKDLVLIVREDHLEVIESEEPISEPPRDFLYQRVSPEFTVEGFLMYRGDTSFFREANTKIDWPLAKLGAYDQAAREHNTLAEKKNDTTYMKATGYAIYLSRKERRIEALVLKRIIQSSSF